MPNEPRILTEAEVDAIRIAIGTGELTRDHVYRLIDTLRETQRMAPRLCDRLDWTCYADTLITTHSEYKDLRAVLPK